MQKNDRQIEMEIRSEKAKEYSVAYRILSVRDFFKGQRIIWIDAIHKR